MKKITAVFLAFLMFVTVFTPTLAADTNDTPAETEAGALQAAVIVPGVIETMLMTDPAGGQANRFYAPLFSLSPTVIFKILFGALKATFFKDYGLVTEGALELEDAAIKNLAMEPDGTSTYPLFTPVSGAAESSYAAMLRSGNWSDVWYGAQIAPDLAKEIGNENVYVFTYDWRLGSPTLTEQFAAFLDEVKSTADYEKIDVYCDSYGCQVVASYLYKHGYDDINRIVFDSPAWTGTRLFKSLMADSEEELHFQLAAGAETLFDFLMIETDLKPILKLLPDESVQHVAQAMIKNAWNNYLSTAPGLWCCCSVDDYEEMKAKLLDPVKNAAVIAEVDEAQYGVMRHVPEILANAQAAGIQLSVIMNEGTPLFAGDNINGDGVIDAATGSGGTCLKLGETFTDGRNGAHVSPANDYDLTDAFLPDRTWVFYGQTHGQSYWDNEAKELVKQLMLTDGPETVFSDPRYPQFSASHCPAYDVSLRLQDRGGCELHPAEGAVQAVLRNDSELHSVIVKSVTVNGLPYSISTAQGFLTPGQEISVTLTPDENAAPTFGKIEISYVEFDILPYAKTRTQFFKVTDN